MKESVPSVGVAGLVVVKVEAIVVIGVVGLIADVLAEVEAASGSARGVENVAISSVLVFVVVVALVGVVIAAVVVASTVSAGSTLTVNMAVLERGARMF